MPVVSALLAAAPSGASPVAPVTIPPCDRAGPCVIVEVLDGTARVGDLHYFYADQITDQGDISDSYPIKGGNDAVVARGSSLNRLVVLSDVDLGEVQFAEVVHTDSYGRHLLSGVEVGPAGRAGFEGGRVPAFYSTDPTPSNPTRWNYIRPQRDPDDANGAEGPDQGSFFTAPQGAFLVRVHLSGEILDVDVTATPVDGTERSFTLSTNLSGPGLGYDWTLPDFSRSTEATPVFTFSPTAVGGTFPVTVGVERDDGSFGWGIGEVRAGPAPAPSPTATPSGDGGDGPADQGPTRNPQASQTADPNPNPSGSTGSPAPSPTAAPSPSASASGSPEPTPSNPTESTTPRPTPQPTPGGDQVSGILLTARSVPVGGTVPADAPRPSPAARPLSEAPFGVPGMILLVVGVVTLLVLGGASESGRVRRRLLTGRKR